MATDRGAAAVSAELASVRLQSDTHDFAARTGGKRWENIGRRIGVKVDGAIDV